MAARHSTNCFAAVTAYIVRLLWLAAALQRAARASAASRYELINSRPGNVLALILTGCEEYQDWQAIAAAFAWRHSGQPGSMVRVANCNEKDTKKYDKRMLEYMKTHMAPDYQHNAELKDWYAAYNKPGAVVDYFAHNSPAEEWVVVLDSDMLLHKPFLAEELPLERGWAYGGHYAYLVGVHNGLALRHVPEIAPRSDSKAGPVGRRGDQVGGPYFMHRDDLSRMAPQWLNYTKIMRTDMKAYKDSGDTAAKKGDRIWIAEMYGYSFGAAKSNVWHIWHEQFMLYPGDNPDAGIPYVLHYGLLWHVNSWTYDKHFFFDFDAHKCPPWDLSVDRPQAGIFPPPPGPKEITQKEFLDRYKDILATSVIALVNAALCDYHVRSCPPSPQLTSVCSQAFRLWHEVEQEMKDLEWNFNCTDHNSDCSWWAENGECTKTKQYMQDHCRVSCKYCTPQGPRPKGPFDDQPMSVEELSTLVGVKAAAAGEAAASTASPPSEPAPPTQPAVQQTAKQPADAPKQQQQQQQQQPSQSDEVSEADLRKRYPASKLSFAELLKRCTSLQGLAEPQMRECVKVSNLGLQYPGTPAAAPGLQPGTPDDGVKAGSNRAAKGREVRLDAAVGSAQGLEGVPNDLASLHAAAVHAGKLTRASSAGRIPGGRGSSWAGPSLDGMWGKVLNAPMIGVYAVIAMWLLYVRLRKQSIPKGKAPLKIRVRNV